MPNCRRGTHLRREGGGAPRVIVSVADYLGGVLPDEIGHCTDGISVEHTAILGNHLLEPFGVGGKIVNLISLGLEASEEVEERGGNLHTLGHQCILAGTFEIEYGYLLVAVGLVAQGQVVADGSYEIVEAVGYGCHVW